MTTNRPFTAKVLALYMAGLLENLGDWAEDWADEGQLYPGDGGGGGL